MLLDEETIVEVDKGIMYMNTGRQSEAAQLFTNILIKNDKNPLVWNNRGLALLQLGHPFDAIMNIEKAVALQPAAPEYYVNMGACYAEFEDFDKAIGCYNKALALKTDIPQAHLNLGNSLKYKGDHEAAVISYRNCVKADPEYVDGRLGLAFCELGLGNYDAGWREFEWRWKSNQLIPRGLPIKEWKGENLNGKTLMIYGEQGHGDSLQFVRYVSMVKQKYNCKVVVEVRQPLTRLIKSMDDVDAVITYGELVPDKDIDYMVAVMSLPGIFGTTVDTIPWNGPYFKADPYRVTIWQQRLKALPPGMRVGVCWAGLSRPGRPQADAIDRRRSTTIEAFAPLAKVPGLSWVSLQKGLPRDQIGKPPSGMTIGDWTDELDDFYDTAALIDCLDLVISVDTAVVHLAAALGKPTWLLSRWDGCWRWLNGRVDSPWYPTLRQFVHPAPHAWGPMMEQAAVALREYVTEHTKKAA